MFKVDKPQKIGPTVLASIFAMSCCSATFAQEQAAKSDAPACSVNMIEPTQSGAESEGAIELVRNITRALADHDYVALGGYMDENCSCYNEHTGKLVSGRDAIVKDVKTRLEAEERRLKVPPISFTIDHPYARVSGDTATVNFVLVKEIGGVHPAKFQQHCTDVLVKREGKWKKLMFRGDEWKVVK